MASSCRDEKKDFVQDRYGFESYPVHMHANPFRTILIVSLLAGTATALVGQDQLDKYRTQMANMGPQAPATPQDGGSPRPSRNGARCSRPMRCRSTAMPRS